MASTTYSEEHYVVEFSEAELMGYIIAGLAADGVDVALPTGGETQDGWAINLFLANGTEAYFGSKGPLTAPVKLSLRDGTLGA